MRDALAAELGVVTHDLQRQRYVALDGPPRKQRRGLENIAVVPLQPRLVGRNAIDRKAAGGGLFEVGNNAQQRGLAAARRPDEGNEVAVGDIEIDIGERLNLAIGSLEGQRDTPHLDREAGRITAGWPKALP